MSRLRREGIGKNNKINERDFGMSKAKKLEVVLSGETEQNLFFSSLKEVKDAIDSKKNISSPEERQRSLEEYLITLEKKEILAKEIYDDYKKQIKETKEEILACMNERFNEEKMPLLQEMIRIDRIERNAVEL